jgi:glyoxylase-like metal-dependent hydrolase (beta-lactamase superfamily II)
LTPDDPIRVTSREFAANTYLVRTSTPGECVLIDPGLDRDAIESALADARLVPVAIFVTHGHFDHIGSAEHFRRKYSVALHMHAADSRLARSSNFMMMAFGLADRILVPEGWVAIDGGFSWSRGPDRVQAVHVPGHTAGSTILTVNGRMFTGDTIYRDEVWLTPLPELDLSQLRRSVLNLWDVLPEAAMVYPGHGGAASFGQIKQSNTRLRELLGLSGSVARG